MFKRFFLFLKNFDWILFSSVLLLVCFGLAEIYSVALGRGGTDFLNFKKQAIFCIVGVVLLFIFSFFNYHSLRSFSIHFYILGVLALIAVLFFGTVIRGTRGWFYLGSFGLQPVEFIKFILILFLARYFADVSLKVNSLRHFIVTAGGVFIFIVLIIFQPDFGSALILFLLWFSMVIIAGFKKQYLITVTVAVVIAGILLWSFYFQSYQKERLLTFLNPSFNPINQGYNIAQAIIAVGAGRIFGRGIGFGSQSQLKFLPESQNDFIFAVVSEELGFLGAMLVLLFFSIFFYRCLASLKKINNDFGIFFILGATCLIFIEMFINIGMNIGILPVVGISLPFLSYGGSAMITNLILVGIVESIVIRSKINY